MELNISKLQRVVRVSSNRGLGYVLQRQNERSRLRAGDPWQRNGALTTVLVSHTSMLQALSKLNTYNDKSQSQSTKVPREKKKLV